MPKKFNALTDFCALRYMGLLMQNIFDSHAHYDDSRFDSDRDMILSSLREKGVSFVMNAASNIESAHESITLAERYDFVYASAGVHPHDAKTAPADLTGILKPLLRHEKVKAVGEIGLDYHYDFSPRDTQIMVFEAQLKLSVEADMPVIVHDREAHADTLRLLKEYKPRGVVHCFSGSREMAEELVGLGLYIGFTGAVTFKNARKALEAIAAIPLDRLLIETDCPYMAPEPYRGKRCDSSMLDKTAEVIAGIKNLSPQEIADITSRNAREIYGI